MVGKRARPVKHGNLFQTLSNERLGLGNLVSEGLDRPVFVLGKAPRNLVEKLIFGPPRRLVVRLFGLCLFDFLGAL